MPRFLFLTLLTVFTTFLSVGQTPEGAEAGLWRSYAQATQPAERLATLQQLYTLYTRDGADEQADSVAGLRLRVACESARHDEQIAAYEQYFEDITPAKAAQSDDKAGELARLAGECNDARCLAQAYGAKAAVFAARGDARGALDKRKDAYIAASQSHDEPLLIGLQLDLGDALNTENQKMEAFGSYLRAFHTADSLENDSLRYACYGRMAAFSYLINDFKAAHRYRDAQLQLLKDKHGADDEDRRMELNVEEARYYMYEGQRDEAIPLLQAVVRYARAAHRNALADDAFTVYRKMYLDAGELRRLSDLYQKEYPEEYARVQREKPGLYLRLQAYFSEAAGDFPGARIRYDSAEKQLSGDAYTRSNFHSRYGQFLLRAKDTAAAIAQLRAAYGFAAGADYLPFMMAISQRLDTVFFLRREVDSAYRYKGLAATLNARWADIANREEVLRLNIDAESKRQQLDQQREQRLAKERTALQYTAIALAIGVSFFLLLILNAVAVPRFYLRALSFLSFLFLFEWLNMLLHHYIEEHSLTLESKPLLLLFTKIAIAAVLIPLHHAVEERAIHYLSSHQIIRISKLRIRPLKFRRKPDAKQAGKPPATHTEPASKPPTPGH